MNYQNYISNSFAQRSLSLLLERRRIDTTNKLTSLSVGCPERSTFPFLNASLTLKDGSALDIDPKLMATGLQYGRKFSHKPLVDQLEELTERFHAPPRMSESSIVLTSGSQHGLFMSCELFLNPGDYAVVEEHSCSSFLPTGQRLQARLLSIQCDNQGMDPALLRESLTGCTDGVVKLMYLNPNGTNPSGQHMSEKRRREIYKIACDHDLIILEDDPYYFMQFTEKWLPSFLSLDTEGRVMRLDSLSTIVGGGLRMGYVTGPKPLTEQLDISKALSVIHCTMLTEVILSELLRTWGQEGFMQQVRNVRQLYLARRDVMLEAADKHLKGLCEWMVPKGGMFLWVKVLGVKDTRGIVQEKRMKSAVDFVPGFHLMLEESKPCPYIRASYSVATPDEVDKAFKILAEIIKEEKPYSNGIQDIK